MADQYKVMEAPDDKITVDFLGSPERAAFQVVLERDGKVLSVEVQDS